MGSETPQACAKRGDLILILSFLLVGLLIAVFLYAARETGQQVTVRANGQVIAVLSLRDDQEYPIQDASGVTNRLIIQDGAVWMERADCPDQLCVKQGKIRYAGDSIICLPNHVVVEITGGTDALGLDGVSG